MDLIRLVYASRPFGFDEGTLNSILLKARHHNERDDITGALICRADLYLQWLEGPEDVVEAAYARIVRDDRHLEVKRLFVERVDARMFPEWAMRDDPARSWMWDQDAVADGAVAKASRDDIVAVFERLATETG